jgi:hypothetical protein
MRLVLHAHLGVKQATVDLYPTPVPDKRADKPDFSPFSDKTRPASAPATRRKNGTDL